MCPILLENQEEWLLLLSTGLYTNAPCILRFFFNQFHWYFWMPAPSLWCSQTHCILSFEFLNAILMIFFLVPDAKPVAGHLHSFGHSHIVYDHIIKTLLHYLSHETSWGVNTPAQANANYPGKSLLDKPYFQQRQMHWEFLVLWKVGNLFHQRNSSIWLCSDVPFCPIPMSWPPASCSSFLPKSEIPIKVVCV